MGRSDLYSKKIGELLLKGWRMLDESCPETGEVPLMQEPNSDRRFSIAVGKFVDEIIQAPPLPSMVPPAAEPTSAASTILEAPTPMAAPTPAGAPAPSATHSRDEATELCAFTHEQRGQIQEFAASRETPCLFVSPPSAAVHSAEQPQGLRLPPVLGESGGGMRSGKNDDSRGKSDSDRWCEHMSQLMLKGWKMLGDNCPATGQVPLMEHPSNGRKFSVATGKFLDEMEPPRAIDEPISEEVTANSAKPSAAMKPASAPASESLLPLQTGQSLEPVPAATMGTATSTVEDILITPTAAPRPASTMAAPPPAAPPTVAHIDARGGTVLGGGSAVSAIASAICVVQKQLTECTSQLAGGPSPPVLSLLEAITKCAHALTALEEARRQVAM